MKDLSMRNISSILFLKWENLLPLMVAAAVTNIKVATKLYFTHYSCVVIILFNDEFM